jgi:hypothetical protein
MPLAKDLLHPSIEEERQKHKKKRLVQSPNSYFMDVKCPGCYKITTGKSFFFCQSKEIKTLHRHFIFLFSFQPCTNGRLMCWL